MPNITFPNAFLTNGSVAYDAKALNLPGLYSVYGLPRRGIYDNMLAGAWPVGALAYMRPIFDAQVSTDARAAGQIFILPGTIMDPNDAVKSVSTLESSALVTITNDNTAAGPFVPSLPPINTAFTSPWITLNSAYVAAAQAGTATWFAIICRAATNRLATNAYHAITGTVGPKGSGADLEIDNPDVTAGKLYRIANLKLSLPTTIEYQ